MAEWGYNRLREKAVILIPALNPPDTFADYIKELIQAGFQDIIVVDDGSASSRCFEEIQNMGGTILKHKRNEGKGQALKTGFFYYKEKYLPDGYAGVITVDSDGQHLVKDVEKIAAALTDGTGKLILGSRDFSLPQVPPKSRFGNNLTVKIFKYFLRMDIRDTQTGLRGIPNCLIDECLGFPGKRFEYETEMLMAVGKKAGICEVPVETVYLEANKETHFNPVVDSLKIYYVIFRTFFRYVFSSLSASLLDLSLFALFSKLVFGKWKYKIWIATAIARGVSACYNFGMNRSVVFRSNRPLLLSAVGYFSLCIVQGLASAVLVSTVTERLRADEVLVKLIVDTLLFFVSYQIQRKLIFKRGEGGHGKQEKA